MCQQSLRMKALDSGVDDNNEILIKDNMIVNSGTTNDFY